MYGLFIQIFIDAAILWAVLMMFQDSEISLGMTAALGFLTAVITFFLAWGLSSLMGSVGVYVAILLAAIILGFAVSALTGLEIKRAIMIAGIFMLAKILVGVIISSMTRVPAETALSVQLLTLLT